MTAMTWYALLAAVAIMALPVAFYLLRVFSKKKVAVPIIRPSFEEQPPLRPAMLVEVVEGGYLLGPRIFCRELPDGFDLIPGRTMIRGKPFIYARAGAEWISRKRDDPLPPGVHRYVDGIRPPDGWWRVFVGTNGDAEGEAL